ncbi:hypothetical protein HMPREF9372_0102 [Sporosarcina newyorkensis 2681]|uniref:Uncharacterized protein n=1 Tax=Sporosarcina newyorkensis 2681 TaxID=1027292 RepID=F9DMS2_9BACL|nr:hypothetical protein HMPREF9372_0102 [Sporosarcina newyorkensis 2681]
MHAIRRSHSEVFGWEMDYMELLNLFLRQVLYTNNTFEVLLGQP